MSTIKELHSELNQLRKEACLTTEPKKFMELAIQIQEKTSTLREYQDFVRTIKSATYLK